MNRPDCSNPCGHCWIPVGGDSESGVVSRCLFCKLEVYPEVDAKCCVHGGEGGLHTNECRRNIITGEEGE